MNDIKDIIAEKARRKKILRENWDIYTIAQLFIEIYPSDLFHTEPKIIVELRKGFEKITQIKNKE